MTQEDKQLLLKDLSGRVPYGVFVKNENIGFEGRLLTLSNYQPTSVYVLTDIASGNQEYSLVEDIRPYLRPMSSMTEEEEEEYELLIDCSDYTYFKTSDKVIDWLNAHHFDFRGLIDKGIALEALEDMYKTE